MAERSTGRTEPAEAPAARRTWSRRGWSVRARVLAALVALSGLALAAAGVTAYGIERARLDDRLDDTLERTVEELRAIAAGDVDPSTGEPFTSAEQVLRVSLQRVVPARYEGAFSIGTRADGSWGVLQFAEVSGIQPHTDAAFVSELEGAELAERATITRTVTPTADYRYAVAPVRVGDAPPAALVVAFDRGSEQAALAATYRQYAAMAAVALAGIALVGWLVVGRVVRPIRLVRRTAQEISESDLSARIPVVGNDDLADLTVTVNDMLDRLETSFADQRQLLDDVGHELRTPLTVVRGHLELMDPADPEDAAQTRALAMDELDRMYGLVDDLVTLARAERPDFVRRREVDVAVLVDEVLAKARPLGERRWRLDALPEGTAELDPQRLTQALLQLASNAVRFSDDGSTVGLGGAWSGDGALELWVRDEGIGIAEEEQAHVFQRFARGSTARARGDGSGLGLAIVASIAHAHGGSVTLDSAPGRGTTVTLRIPDAGLPDPDADAPHDAADPPARQQEAP
ncbi:histidine kinase [Beutenbergia cavernae DSM 12333]|uniref:histidine kinase n=2 Tax=Beutenbergia TaxID=84756 RepID=C5C0L4_BEUC1|nr:histidine kinase [Beutenbergia cavernae DSM 12333]